ncbi:MAG: hypothetical protein LBW77_04935 [Verrucomicrobiota bacterium]|jgi:hypothetical protein|nr:hypothetical protein [Verrucomicrobiota bacterium]
MRRTIFLLAALLAWAAGAAEEVRTWTSRAGGSTLKAAFVKEDKGVVTLKKEDGSTVQAKLEQLSEEDGDYVRELTYEPQNIAVTFRRERLGRRFFEIGTSKPATVHDTVVLRIDHSADDAKPDVVGDSTWKVESVDAVGKSLLSRNKNEPREWTTDGKFVFLTYQVQNDASVAIEVFPPTLIDQRGRRFNQMESEFARDFIPAGALIAGRDPLQPGFKKLFSGAYELPAEAVPAAVEVYPSVKARIVTANLTVRRAGGPVEGKTIGLGVKIVADAPPPPAPPPETTDTDTAVAEPKDAKEAKISIFMKCTRVGQSGDTGNQWYYDRSKTRSLTYGIELRVLGDQGRKIKVKAFFIGEASANRDLVVDKKEAEVSLEPGKIARTALQSEEIKEQSYYYYYYTGANRERVSGAKLKGVIIQAWSGNTMVSGWASLNQWRKFADSPDVAKDMGEMQRGESGY